METLGRHMIVDITGDINSLPFWNMDHSAALLKEAVLEAGATIINERWHHFGAGCGYTGIIVLAESHLSIHTWPEKGFAAIDVFMCGDCNPQDTLKKIVDTFSPIVYTINVLDRGPTDS